MTALPSSPAFVGAGAKTPRPAPWWFFLGAGCLHALVFACLFPPLNGWFFAPIALLPLAWAAGKLAWAPGKMRWRLLLVWLGSSLACAWINLWMMNVAFIGYPVQAIYLGIYPTIFTWALAKWYRTARGRLPLSLVVPTLWTGLEVIKGEVLFGGYAWHLLAHPLIEVPVLAAPASWIGAYGVTFMVAAWAGIAADALPGLGRPWPYRWGAPTTVGALTIAVWVSAAILRPAPDPAATTFTVTCIQTNVAQDNKNTWSPTQSLLDFRDFARSTLSAATPAPDLIVWPETMFPGLALNAEAVAAERLGLGGADAGPLFFTVELPAPAPFTGTPETDFVLPTGRTQIPTTFFHDQLLTLQQRAGVPMIVGATALENLRFIRPPTGGIRSKSDRHYNSAFEISNGAVQSARYDKIVLTPFGEVIPAAWRWPALQNWFVGLGAAGMTFDLASGQREQVFEIKSASKAEKGVPTRVVTPICFEATAPALCRRLVYGADLPAMTGPGARRADVIINISNDGWFGEFPGVREQHLQAARWRCVELGIPMVRCVNTGISTAIDCNGVITAILPPPGGLWTTPQSRAGVLRATVTLPPRDRRTVYGQFGDVLGWLCVAFSAAGVFYTLVRATILRRKQRAELARSSASAPGNKATPALTPPPSRG